MTDAALVPPVPSRPIGLPPERPSLASFDFVRAHPVVQRLSRRVPWRAPVGLLVLAMIVWFVLFAYPVVWRHDRYGSFDHDLGIWDQYVWLLSRGQINSFITVRGLSPFGFHASPAMAVYVPFYWLGAGTNFLDLTMVGTVCAGAIPVFRAARHHLRNEWHALVLAVAFLVNYAAQWMMQETFHPEVMAVTFLLFAYLAAVEGRWRAYAVWLVLALMWKEDIALTALMIGLVFVVRGRRTVTGRLGPELTRRMGVCTVIGCAGWFVFATRVLIPHFSSAGAFTESLFGNLGATPTDMVRTAVSDPAIVRQHLELSNPVEYFRQLTGSFGFVALLSPLMLLVAIPQAAINLLAVYNFFWVTNVHYAALPLLAVAIASIEGVARFRREGVRRFLLGAVAMGAFFTCVSWGISPFSASYRAGFWPLEPIPNQQLLDDVVALPGPDEAVSAMYNLVPHLTHRNEAYTFPNPWIPLNWGVEGENRPNPTDVDWILVNPAALSDADGGALVSAITQPDRLYKPGEQAKPPADKVYGKLVDRTKWRVVIDQPSMLALHRVRA